MSRRLGGRAAALAALIVPVCASAHGFGRLYNLPVPFWLYAWGAGAALVASFAIAGYFAGAPAAAPTGAGRDVSGAWWVRALARAQVVPALRGLAVAALLLCIATGFLGSRDPFRNFSMTAFWIVFVLGLAYVSALAGDLYAAINPWRALAQGLGRLWRGYAAGRVRYPERLGDWPALALYLAFVWYELYNHGRPGGLAAMLLGYTLLNLAAVGVFGAPAWFRHGELFAVFFRLLGLMAPIGYTPGADGRGGALRLRPPFAGLVRERPEGFGTLAFALAMLSTTAFDGLRATQAWVALFWARSDSIGTWLAPGELPARAVATLLPWYIGWETSWLLASPFLYLGAYLVAIALARALGGGTRPLRDLALDFGYTLLPIALVYNVTHYATLVLTQGVKIVSLLSDPFGWGWNLFGTATLFRMPILPPMGLVWHAQVALILAGHIASVGVAHVVALRVFPSRRRAMLSQLPMLVLMVAFTVAGLWILAQPLTEVLMR